MGMGQMSSSQYDKLYDIYCAHGQSAVEEAGRDMNLPFKYCEPCENAEPIVTLDSGDKVCGVCGTVCREEDVDGEDQVSDYPDVGWG